MLCTVLLASCTGVVCAADTTEAAEKIDVSRTDCSLTVSYSAAADCGVTQNVKLHRIADVSADFQYTLLSDYPPVELNGISTQDEWNAVAETLGAYIAADQIEPFRTVSTDAGGEALFAGLCPGLYYVEGCTFTSGRTTYTYAPFLVNVPELETDGTWNYHAAAVPKHTETTDKPDTETKEYTVIKVWKTAAGASHPDSVKVELYKNGNFAETQTLSAANNWMYTWSDDTESSWTAVERDVPDGYTVSISGERVITITNSTPGSYNPPRTGDTRPTWLYVLMLAASGAGLIVLALLGRKKKQNEDE